MARSAGAIKITLSAGTAEFFSDIEKSNAKIIQFGKNAEAANRSVETSSHGAVSQVQATSGALRVLEGGMTNNLRAAEKFTAGVLGLGPVLQAAFPLIGGIAFLGLLTKLGAEVYKFYRDIASAPEKTAGMFRELNSSVQITNDAMAVSNDRLEQEIAKLEGKRQNTLALALDEARQSADKLAESLDRDLKSLDKVLGETNKSVWHKFFDVRDELTKEIGGETGQGGFVGQIADIHATGNARFDEAAKLPTNTETQRLAAAKAREAAQSELNTKLQEAYGKEIAKLTERLRQAIIHREGTTHVETSGLLNVPINVEGTVTKADIERVQGALRQLQNEKSLIGLTSTSERLTARKEADEAKNANQKQDRPFDSKINELKAAAADAALKLKSAGLDEVSKMIATAEGDAIKAIEHVNEGLKKQHAAIINTDPHASDKGQQILAYTLSIQVDEADTKRINKLQEITDQLNDQIKTQRMLNEAIGKGWEAQKAVNVEIELMKEFGAVAYNADPDSKLGKDVGTARILALTAAQERHNEQQGISVDRLGDELAMQRVLAEAQSLGAFAVERAAQAEQIRQQKASAAGLTAAGEQAEWDKFYAARLAASNQSVHATELEIAASERMIAAVGKGAAAMRQAQIDTQVAAIRDKTGAVGSPEEQEYLKREAAAHSLQAVEAGAATDRLQHISDEIAKLNEAKKALDHTLAIKIQIRNLEREYIDELVQESLAGRSARDGFRAFMLEMQQEAKSTGRIVYEALHGAFDQTSSNVAKALTGQGKKADWAKQFQGLGEQMIDSTVKSAGQRGLSALAKHFPGLGVPQGKPDGSTKGLAFWVQLADNGLVPRNFGDPGILGRDLGKGGLFGGGDQGGGIFSLLGQAFGGFRAGGGDVSAGNAYVVGENHPEVFVPSTSGRIIPHFGGAGGSGSVHYHIDARGADLGVMNRVARGMQAVHKASVANAVQASHERTKRTPGK